ncbi:insulinase family protein [Opitutus sp. ER46]|uniref:M16 family metallopeptidase n=1 Tax=Opitutus sp. ER46 TaxID=2161864 RepID=UPI000D311CE7|nr:insulinase family protein [Opitutus sp. ER46]PTY01087.1 hypothetical protein DB354_00705 [Opitutus sp. ER46]
MLSPRALLAIAVLTWCGASQAGAAETAGAAPPNFALTAGTLPNGLRYVVLPHRPPTGGIALRLLVRAGSLDERDGERGYAHFVEHMAFNGTKHFPPGRLVAFFQRLGAGFGADVNAETSFRGTTYRIDLPPAHVAQLAEALQVFRDFADGVEFAPKEVQREKSVIQSELVARNNGGWRDEVARIGHVFGGTLAPQRMPAGSPELVASADAAGLKAYYERCYRPERMTLVVVGDVGPEPVAALMRETFGTLVRAGAANVPIEPELPRQSGMQAHVIPSGVATAAVVTVSALAQPGADTLERREASMAREAVLRMLQRRLADRQRLERDRVGVATAGEDTEISGAFECWRLEAHAKAEFWTTAVTLLETELRRACVRGFSAEELREATGAMVASRREMMSLLSSFPTGGFANLLVARELARMDWRHPSQGMRETDVFVARFTLDEANATLRAMFAEPRLRLALRTRLAPPGGSEELMAAWRTSAAKPLAEEQAAGAAALTFGYDDFGAPGAVTSRRRDEELGVEQVTLGNGVRLNLRASRSEPGHFRLVARLGRGFLDVPAERPGLPVVASVLLAQADLGRNTRQEISRLFALHSLSASHRCEGVLNEVTLRLSGPTAELPFALRYVTAFLSDVKLEEARLPDAFAYYSSAHGHLFKSAADWASVQLIFRLMNGDRRLQRPPAADVMKYSFADVAGWAREHVLEGPVEVGIAGDFAEAEAVAAVAGTLGTLPTRRPAAAPTAAERLRFPRRQYQEVRREALTQQAGAVSLGWPVKAAEDPRTVQALRIGTQVLVDRLRQKLREDRGETYAPSGGVARFTLQRDMIFARVDVTASPEKTKDMAQRVFRIADDLAWGGVTEDEFERAREPLRAADEQRWQSNAWWVEAVLMYAQSVPAELDDLRVLRTASAKVTREEVNRVIAKVFHPDNAHYCGVVPLAPAAPPTTAAAK